MNTVSVAIWFGVAIVAGLTLFTFWAFPPPSPDEGPPRSGREAA